MSLSLGIGLGLSAAGGGGGGTNPFAGIPDCAFAHLFDTDPNYMTDGGTTPTNVDDPVGRWVAAAGPNGLQSSSSLRPTRKADGLSLDATDDCLAFGPVVTPGDFTFYLSCTIGSTSDTNHRLVPLGGSNGSATVVLWAPIYGLVVALGASAGTNRDTGWTAGQKVLIRIRRSGSTTYTAATGLSEVSDSLGSASHSWGWVGRRAADDSARNGSALHRYRDRLIFTRDLSGGERTTIETYFSARGYSL